MNKIIFWLKAARVHTLPMSFMSWLVVFCFAVKQNGNIILGIITLFGIMLAHLGVNLIDDYFDYKNEVKTITSSEEKKQIKMQKGKCQYIINGSATLNQTLFAAITFFGLAAIIGLTLTVICGWQVAAIALLASIFCMSYPKLTYIGLSELAVGLTFAPFLFVGTYFVMTGILSIKILLLSISTGLLTVGLLHTHAIMDYDFDIKDNKKTLCTILGSKEKSIVALGIMMFLAYLNIAIGVTLKLFPPQTLLTFLTIPLAISLIYLMNLNRLFPEVITDRKFWMGPMENWEEIKTNNAQNFMIRFYISRNIMVFFSLFLCIGIIFS